MNLGRLTFTASLLFWSVMMGLLLRGHCAPSRAGSPDAIIALVKGSPAAQIWYGIYHAQRKIGYGELAVSADALSDAISYTVRFYIKLAFPETVLAQGEVSLNDPGGFERFALQVRSGAAMLSLGGSVADGDLCVHYDLGDFAHACAALFPGVGLPPAGSGRLPLSGLAENGVTFKVGREEVVNIYGVLTPTRSYRISSAAGDINVWVDQHGGVVRADLPNGIAVIREPQPLAKKM